MSTETLEIKKENAQKAFNTADTKGKELLNNLFGKETFVQKITDRIKTFQDACNQLNIDAKQFEISSLSNHDEISINSYRKLIIIARALNEGWTPDWSNSNQYKYVPWFKNKSGFGLSLHFVDYWFTFTVVGSRLCFCSRELAEYAATQFADLYNDYLSIKQNQ